MKKSTVIIGKNGAIKTKLAKELVADLLLFAEKNLKQQYVIISELEQQNNKLQEQNKKQHELINWIKEAFGEYINEDYGYINLNGFIEDFLKEANDRNQC